MQIHILVDLLLLVAVIAAAPQDRISDDLQDEPILSAEDDFIYDRRKRQTAVSGGANVENLPHGIRKETANINLEHSINKHTFGAGIDYERHRIPGFSDPKNVGANIGYKFQPNKDTTFSINAGHSRGSGGRSNSFGLGFRHVF
ncbi:hypothetical protein OTU49_014498 [Cherax quadricarinatus]|uniref:Attacin C-terminal domain-containing protein n=1 Tax=Cherax quadricarinatus TaxID=27406 RepID=A0AAW0VNF0_CHEQU|nr:uncharacterized protein LOC128700468 [Cherax quadricarinatus]